jgi:hypothetical protein
LASRFAYRLCTRGENPRGAQHQKRRLEPI